MSLVFEDTHDFIVAGNYIGTDVTGTQPLGNQFDGISISESSNNTIGGPNAAGNLIAFNGTSGIDLIASQDSLIEGNTIHSNQEAGILLRSGISTGNRITKNSIYNNTLIGIDLSKDILEPDGVTPNDPSGMFVVGDPLDADTGANNLQNFPKIFNDVYVNGNTATIAYNVLSDQASSTFPTDNRVFS